MTDNEKMSKNKLLILPVMVILLTTALSGCFGGSSEYHYYGVSSDVILGKESTIENTTSNFQQLIDRYNTCKKTNITDTENNNTIFLNVNGVRTLKSNEDVYNARDNCGIYISKNNITVRCWFSDEKEYISEEDLNETLESKMSEDKEKLQSHFKIVLEEIKSVYGVEEINRTYSPIIEGPIYVDG